MLPIIGRPRRTPEFLFGLFWRAAAGAGDLDEAYRCAGRRGFARRRRCSPHSICGNGRGSSACASEFCRSFSWPCTTGSSATCLCCSARMPSIPMCSSCRHRPMRPLRAKCSVWISWRVSGTLRSANRELAEWPCGILRDHSAECRRCRHSHLCRLSRPPVRSVAAADRRVGARAACRRAVLHGGHRALPLPDLVSHHAGGDGLAATAGRRIGCDGAIRRCRSSSSQIPWSQRLASGLDRLQKVSA